QAFPARRDRARPLTNFARSFRSSLGTDTTHAPLAMRSLGTPTPNSTDRSCGQLAAAKSPPDKSPVLGGRQSTFRVRAANRQRPACLLSRRAASEKWVPTAAISRSRRQSFHSLRKTPRSGGARVCDKGRRALPKCSQYAVCPSRRELAC